MQEYFSYVASLAIIGLFWIRYRGGREVRLNNWKLAGSALIICVVISAIFLTKKHDRLDSTHLVLLAFSALSGLAVGILRARAFALRRVDGVVFMKSSNFAFVFLWFLVLARSGIRESYGGHSAKVVDASMLFALFMVMSQRITVWKRARALLR